MTSPNLSIVSILHQKAIHYPHNIAIVAPDRRPLTYRGLQDAIADVAAKLNAMGIGCGDQVAIALPNGPEMAVAFLAIATRSQRFTPMVFSWVITASI